MESFPFLFRVKMVNQAPMESQESAVLLVPKVPWVKEAYLESLAEMWVDGISLLACELQMGDAGANMLYGAQDLPQEPDHRGLGRFCPPVRCSLLSLPSPSWLGDTICLTWSMRLHCLQNNAGLTGVLGAPPHPGTLPSWKLFLWWALFKLTGKQAVCWPCGLWTNCATLFCRAILAPMACLDGMDPQEAK